MQDLFQMIETVSQVRRRFWSPASPEPERSSWPARSRSEPARRETFRLGKLRRVYRNTARIRVVWLRERLLHRRQRESKGLFEAANSGTIFLDEIGEMSPAMQVKLLRVLQERKVRPVGATDETIVDTRVIAATNRDLASMVSAAHFAKISTTASQ